MREASVQPPTFCGQISVGLTAGVSKAEWFMSGHRKKPLACRSVELAVVSAGNAPLDYYFSKQSGTMQCKHRIETFGQ